LDDLEEYTNSSERSATIEPAEQGVKTPYILVGTEVPLVLVSGAQSQAAALTFPHYGSLPTKFYDYFLRLTLYFNS